LCQQGVEKKNGEKTWLLTLELLQRLLNFGKALFVKTNNSGVEIVGGPGHGVALGGVKVIIHLLHLFQGLVQSKEV
jgi:hypothetical protein